LIGLFSGSVALITDAVHSGADSITRFASWFGLKIAQRKPDERFPYGYYKAETLAALFVSVLILYAGFEMLMESLSSLSEASVVEHPVLALAVSLASVVIAYLFAFQMRRVGKEINSQSLLANAEEMRVDVYSSLLVFIAVLSTYFRIPYVEGSVGVLLSLLVFKVGLENGKVSLYGLMDVSPSREVEEGIRKVLSSCREIEGFENLRLRQAGPVVFGEVTVKLRGHIDVGRAHEISERIERTVKEKVGRIESFLIHIEPYTPRTVKVAIPIIEGEGLDSKVASHFGRAKSLMFLRLENGDVKSYSVWRNPHIKDPARAGLMTAHQAVKEGIDVLLTRNIGEISFHTLRDHLVDIHLARGETVREVVNEFIKGETQRLEKPTRELGTEQVQRRLAREES